MTRLCEFCFCHIGSLKLLELECCKRIYHAYCMNTLIEESGYRCPGCKKELTQEAVDEIRIESYHKTVCGICQQDMICRKKINSCDHWFHMDCLSRWTMDRVKCPVCSAEFSENVLERMRLIRLAFERRAMRCFLEEGMGVTKTFPLSLTKFLARIISADYSDDNGDEEPLPNDYDSETKRDTWWTPERILTTLFLRHEGSMPPTIIKYFKHVIKGMHECTWECEEGLCVVKVWMIDESNNERRFRIRRGQTSK